MIKTIAPVNIALIKYWGKASLEPVLPSTPSISVTLKDFYTVTEVDHQETFSFHLNEKPVHEDVLKKTEAFVRLFQPEGPLKLAIRSTNYVPTAAGLASSASGFAALSLALHHFYGHSFDQFVPFTAKGSGSAVRSLKGGAVMWHLDGSIEGLDMDLPAYQMAVVMIDTSPKKIPSREAMAMVQSTPAYQGWVKRNTVRAFKLKDALKSPDLYSWGPLMEESTMDMHALGAIAKEPFVYLKEETLQLWHALIEARKQGLEAYATADAGPNLKIVFKKENAEAIKRFLNAHPFPYVITDFTHEGARLWST
jgi:diphosphomevalonate decarboxylase